MIRPITLICMLLACVSGLYLYQTKHRVLLLDKEIAATVQASTVARERAGVLRAEWTLLNDPERLRALADQFLSLKPVAPGQFTIMAELANRLPAPRAPDAEPAPDALPEPAVATETPRAEPPVARPAPAAPVVAMTAPPPPVAKPPAASPASAPVKQAAEPVRLAERRPTPLIIPSAAPQPSAAPRPPPVYVAPPPMPREAIARSNTGGGQMPPPMPVVASALGMARTMLPPPVPVSATGAASFGRGNGN